MLQTANKAFDFEEEPERITVDHSRFIFIKKPNYTRLVLFNSIVALIPFGFVYLFIRYSKCVKRKGYVVGVFPLPFPEDPIVKVIERTLTKPEIKIIKTEANILLLLACISPALMFSGWYKVMGFLLLMFAGLAPFTLFFLLLGIYLLSKWNPYKKDQAA